MFKFALIAGGIGAAIAYNGYQDWKLTQVLKPEPSVISCQQLADVGPGDNHHITLTDFVLSDQGAYLESDTGKLDTVWFAAAPLGSPEHTAINEAVATQTPATNLDFKVIVEINNISNFDMIDEIDAQESITGFLVNEVRGIDSKIEKILAESYPRVDLDSCWILAIRKPLPTSSVATAKLGGGGLLILIAGGLLFAGFRNASQEEHIPPGTVMEGPLSSISVAPQAEDHHPDNLPLLGQHHDDGQPEALDGHDDLEEPQRLSA
jgi:hypothetical protein